MGSRNVLVGMTAVVLVAAACSKTGGGPSEWDGAPDAALAPSGMVLTGGRADPVSESRSLVIDEAGNVWSSGPWQLTRVTPDGSATTWDASDDGTFARAWGLEPSDGVGVWLKSQESVRLFDGDRFVADLTVPDSLLHVLDEPDASHGVRDVADVAPGEVWIAIESSLPIESDAEVPVVAGRIVSFAAGEWGTVAEFPTQAPHQLVVDGAGTPWVLLRDESGSGAPTVLRWDGERFVAPAGDDPDHPAHAFSIAAEPETDVIYVLDIQGKAIHRYDGTSWDVVADDTSQHVGDSMMGSAFAADETGAWIASSAGVAHVSPDGVWRDHDVRASTDLVLGTPPTVAAGAGRVVVGTGSGLDELEDDAFRVIWEDESTSALAPGWLLAVSSDEVWFGPSRYRDGDWTSPLGPDVDPIGPGALATDGSVWFVTPDGLMRVDGDEVSVAAEDVIWGGTVAGPDGSVWVVIDGEATRIERNGARTSVGHPVGGEVECLLAGAVDGSLWVDTGCSSSFVPAMARWDGSEWKDVALPGPDAWLVGMTVADDGTSWAGFLGVDADDPASGVALYTDDGWKVFPGYPFEVDAAPGGQVCSPDDPDPWLLRCYDAGGAVGTVDVPWNNAVSIAPDGAVWVAGQQVARVGEIPVRQG